MRERDWLCLSVFSRELLYNMSVAVSHEVRAFYNEDIHNGVYGKSGLSCFGPVINIMRHPMWGRNQVCNSACASAEISPQWISRNKSIQMGASSLVRKKYIKFWC